MRIREQIPFESIEEISAIIPYGGGGKSDIIKIEREGTGWHFQN